MAIMRPIAHDMRLVIEIDMIDEDVIETIGIVIEDILEKEIILIDTIVIDRGKGSHQRDRKSSALIMIERATVDNMNLMKDHLIIKEKIIFPF
jgi:hypothetical protein